LRSKVYDAILWLFTPVTSGLTAELIVLDLSKCLNGKLDVYTRCEVKMISIKPRRV
jgi:hypothetical protein